MICMYFNSKKRNKMKNLKRLGIFMGHENTSFISNKKLVVINIASKFNQLEKIKSVTIQGGNWMLNKE
jgi:hypothetical protein